jgi:hypothetical protein
MKKIICIVEILVPLLALIGCGRNPTPRTTTSDQFAVGQVWKYKTRDSETDSRLIIGKVESIEKLGTIIHIKLVGLKIKNPAAPGGFVTQMDHAPITEAKLKESITSLTQEKYDLNGLEEGYNMWLEAYRTSKGGVFTITVKELIDFMEQALAKGTTKN